MNNKGQTLVIVLLILPIVIFILLLILDYGNFVYQKKQLDNSINYAINEYYDNNLNKVELKKLIDKNITYKDITIKKDKNIIIIITKSFGIYNKKDYQITYSSSKINNEIIINKEMK